MEEAIKWVGGAVLLLIFIYSAGRMFTAGVLRSWQDSVKKPKKRSQDGQEE